MIAGKKMQRYAQAGDFKPVVGAHCLNLVTAVIDFYRRQLKRLKTIYLDGTHWKMFIEDLKKLSDDNPGFVIDATAGVPIENSDVTVKRGSRFQEKEMKYEFYDDVEIKVLKGTVIGEC